MNKKLKFGIVIFILGFLGVLSIFFSEGMVALVPEEVKQKFTSAQLNMLLMVNPIILLIISTAVGVVLYDKVKLGTAFVSDWVGLSSNFAKKSNFLYTGILLGSCTGVVLFFLSYFLMPYMPASFLEQSTKFEPSLITKLGYGGITEEILIRFGMMTFLVWLLYKITGKLTPMIYGVGILLSSLLFAAGHLPVLFALSNEFNGLLFMYVILGNTIGGLVYGYLYWKHGLEASILAHMFTHVLMVGLGFF